MLMSKVFVKTLKETPAEAEIISHQLMLRAGMMRKLAAGIYTFLPLGYRVINKIQRIVREEMDKAGAQELLMPALQPAELWEKTGRWDLYGPELVRIKDRHQRLFCLGPTHEEVITDLIRDQIRSYRQLPLILYQIQTKFRDEIRPRFGVMRAREFIMKDAYSFEKDEEGLEINYQKMYNTYSQIFIRCGLKFRAVEAFTGAIGGSLSHEFMVIAKNGEEVILFCSQCDYAANLEKAESKDIESKVNNKAPTANCQRVRTPNIKTVEELTRFLKIRPQEVVKTLIYEVDGEAIAVLIRGDEEINSAKLKNSLGCQNLKMADEKTIREVTSAPVGFAGPVGLKVNKIVADRQVVRMKNFVSGANEKDAHLTGVNVGRDFKISLVADIKVTKVGELCPHCRKGTLKMMRGIEVGHIFKLGNKYTKPMQVSYLDEEGKEREVLMGCYGIGISRIMAAAIEQNYDQEGIIWPTSIAPYSTIIIPISKREEGQFRLSQQLYNDLLSQKVEVVLDDRNLSAGIKFKDADLIGFPIRIVVGKRAVEEGKVEIKLRREKESSWEKVSKVEGKIKELLKGEENEWRVN